MCTFITTMSTRTYRHVLEMTAWSDLAPSHDIYLLLLRIAREGVRVK